MNNWDDIRFFLAVARNGNVTGAAKAVGVKHSTVSRRIQALEEKNGVRLFERVASGYEMNTAGADIYEIALELEMKNQQLFRQLFGQDSRLQGEINLTMPHDIFDYCLNNQLAEFGQLHPDILLNLFVAKGIKNLAAREADVAIRLTPVPPDYLIGKKVATLQHGIYASTQFDPANYDVNKHLPIVVWSGEDRVPDWAKQHFPNARIAMRVDDLYTMYAAVKAGLGVAKMPCYLPDTLNASSSECFNQPLVKRMNIDIAPSSWGVWVLSHADLRYTARVRCCREFLTEQLLLQKNLFEGCESIYF